MAKMLMNSHKFFSMIVGGLFVLCANTGCSGSADKPEDIGSPAAVANMVQMRKMFDESHGNWESLTIDKKETFTKGAGGADKAKILWYRMGHPGPGGPGSSEPGPGGPGSSGQGQG
jgi:hypothetical protein